MRRPNREISVFNISMLDVICSALGAILILFLVTLQAQKQAEASSEDWQAKHERLEQEIQAQSERIAELEEENDALARAAIPDPGTCQVQESRVEVRIRDHGKQDGDRIKLTLINDVQSDVLSNDLLLTNQGTTIPVDLAPGGNILVVEALSLGTEGKNTALMFIDPCRDGQEEKFEWRLPMGGERRISIVRR